MALFKKLAVRLQELTVEMLGHLLMVAVRSLYYAPLFYGSHWLVYRHAPTHDMWYGFAFAAMLYTSSRKRSSRPKKEDAQPLSSLILPASSWKN